MSVAVSSSSRAGTRSAPPTTFVSSSWLRKRIAQYVAPARVAPATIRSSWRAGCAAAYAAASAGSSACGVCGSDSLADALAVSSGTRWDGPLPTPEVVRGLPDAMRAAQQVFDRTGGAHAAALATADGEVLVVREDVGRHNAVDKVTGARVLAGLSPAEACLVVSGRAGFELVQKAVAAGIGSLVAVGAPTSLSVRLATEHGLALYAFTRPGRVVAYSR